ncbi:F0F1 ATP synthase subunit delta [Candidatus Azambacteria bacterium]|nr:F0F1 ATP synthase subunit delta [Candidatus Azambacteria bacterium]
MLEEKYAKALYELAKDKTENEKKKLFLNFVGLLQKNGHHSLMGKILKSYEKISIEKNISDSVELVVADLKFKEQYKKEIKNNKEYIDAKAEMNVVEDGSIIGGFILRSKSVVIDGSYRKALLDLYNNFIK